jgi:hypothetical protein
MGVQAVKIDTEGVATVVDLGENTLKGFYEHIGCQWVDVVRLDPDKGFDMWIDDEGAVVAEPVVNVVATGIARQHGFDWQPYYGTVVFAASNDEGDTIDLPEEHRTLLLAISERWQKAPAR